MPLGTPLTSCRPSTKAKTSSSESRLLPVAFIETDRYVRASDWTFFTDSDPTHGNVQYESQENAQDLAYVEPDGTVVLKVDNQSYVAPGGNRRS